MVRVTVASDSSQEGKFSKEDGTEVTADEVGSETITGRYCTVGSVAAGRRHLAMKISVLKKMSIWNPAILEKQNFPLIMIFYVL